MVMMFVGGVVLMFNRFIVLFLQYDIYGVGVFHSHPNPYGLCCEAVLLTAYQLLALMSAKFLRSFFGDWYLQRFLSVVSV